MKRGEGAASRPSVLRVPVRCVCLGVYGADGTNRGLVRCVGLKLVWTESRRLAVISHVHVR